MTAKKNAKKPRPTRQEALPATGTGGEAPHVGRACRGCACMQCAAHRLLERQAARYAALPSEPSTARPVVGSTATPELRSALGAE